MRSIGYQDTALLLTQLSLLIKAGIPLQQGIETIEDVVDKQLVESLKSGEGLADALSKQTDFPEYAIEMIRVSELSGSLDNTLDNLASYYTKLDAILNHIKKEIVSSIILSILLMSTLSITIFAIVPLLSTVYRQIGVTLNESLWKSFGVLGILIVGLELSIVLFVYINWIRGNQDKVLSIASKFSKGIREIQSDYIAGQLSNILYIITSSGYDIGYGFKILQDIFKNEKMKRITQDCEKEFNSTGDFGYTIEKSGLFNSLYTKVIQTGIMAGRLEESLRVISDGYNESIHRKIEDISSKIGPMLVLVLELAIGITLFSLILPLVQAIMVLA